MEELCVTFVCECGDDLMPNESGNAEMGLALVTGEGETYVHMGTRKKFERLLSHHNDDVVAVVIDVVKSSMNEIALDAIDSCLEHEMALSVNGEPCDADSINQAMESICSVED